MIDGKLVVLDRRTSRYFLIADAAAAGVAPSSTRDRPMILSWPDDRRLRSSEPDEHIVVTATADVDRRKQIPSPWTILRFWRAERRMSARLRLGLDAGLRAVTDARASTHPPPADAWSANALVAASWWSRRLWPARDRCLPRALALTQALRTTGRPAMLIIGVALEPFCAHAWVQAGDLVLDDSLDHIALFTPIFVA